MNISRFRECLRQGVAPGWMHHAMTLNKKDADTPDYSPLADASKESAEIMAGLGRDQMAEGKRQFDETRTALAPVMQAQLGIMQDSRAQGADYYNYMKDTFRPVEQSLVKDANEFNTTAAKEQFSRKAVADLESAQANELAQSNRAMASMGINPNSGRFASANRASGLRAAADRANVATGSRLQAEAMGTQKKMDAIAIGKGMAGFSSDANRTALSAGSGYSGSQMAPGQAYMNSMGMGANTIGAGRQMAQSGLGGVLNSQTNVYGADTGGASGMQNAGALMGGVAQLYSAFQ